MSLFNVLEVLIYQYLCRCFRLIYGFILVFSRFIPLFSFFFARNIAYICTCVRYTHFFFNILIYFVLFLKMFVAPLYCR